MKLLTDPTAIRLLASDALARLEYNAKDGTPRMIPVLFAWTGYEVGSGTYPGSAKLSSSGANPDAASTVDTPAPPPGVVSAGIPTVRIAMHPTWVGALDFQPRVPAGMS